MCENGGTCRFQAGSFFCDCPPGFSGTLCENAFGELILSLFMASAGLVIYSDFTLLDQSVPKGLLSEHVYNDC